MTKDIGRIVEVKGVNVKAKLFRLLPPYLVENGNIVSAPKINSFVKTKVGLDTIICQVVGEYNVEKEDKTLDHYIDLKVKGYIDGKKFIQGLRILPITSSNLSLLSLEDYAIIYDYDKRNSFVIGDDLFEINKSIALNFNTLIPSHIGIFGNTGSGKSNTLTNIYSNYLKRLKKVSNKNAKIIFFDLNNEYGDDSICSLSDKVLYNLTTRSDSKKKIPFNFSNIDEDELGVLLNATMKTQLPTLKNAFKQLKEEHDANYYKSFINNILVNNQKDLFYAIRFHLNEYIKNIDHIHWFSSGDNKAFRARLSNGDMCYSDKDEFESKVVDPIEIKLPQEPLDRLKFELCFSIAKECEHGINGDYLLPLLNRADKLFKDLKKVFDFSTNKDMFEGKDIMVVQLANTNSDMTMIVPGLLSKCIFQSQINEKDEGSIKSIVSIVMDEAHNILSREDESSVHNNTLEVFEKIVKEGRKFGLFLTVASQRPSDISHTILSQLHNYFIHKLVNPNDLFQIRKTVTFLDENALDFLTILAPGECILSGTVVKMPVFMKVHELDDGIKPNSNNVVLFGEDGILN